MTLWDFQKVMLLGGTLAMLVRAVLAAAFVGITAPALTEPENTHWPNYQEGRACA